jgi:hypothetical protein
VSYERFWASLRLGGPRMDQVGGVSIEPQPIQPGQDLASYQQQGVQYLTYNDVGQWVPTSNPASGRHISEFQAVPSTNGGAYLLPNNALPAGYRPGTPLNFDWRTSTFQPEGYQPQPVTNGPPPGWIPPGGTAPPPAPGETGWGPNGGPTQPWQNQPWQEPTPPPTGGTWPTNPGGSPFQPGGPYTEPQPPQENPWQPGGPQPGQPGRPQQQANQFGPFSAWGYGQGPNGELLPVMLNQGRSPYQMDPTPGLLGQGQQGPGGLLGPDRGLPPTQAPQPGLLNPGGGGLPPTDPNAPPPGAPPPGTDPNAPVGPQPPPGYEPPGYAPPPGPYTGPGPYPPGPTPPPGYQPPLYPPGYVPPGGYNSPYPYNPIP